MSKKSVLSFIFASIAFSANAAYDAKFVQGPESISYFSDFYLAKDDWRTIKQLETLNEPDQNGYIYVEHVSEYNCSNQTYKIVETKGFKTWDDVGTEFKLSDNNWKPVKGKYQYVYSKLCGTTKLADAKIVK